jgi:uncharacterized protein YcfJ
MTHSVAFPAELVKDDQAFAGTSLDIDGRMSSHIMLVCTLSASVLAASVPSEASLVRCGPRRHAVVRPIRLSNGVRADEVICIRTVALRRAPHRSWKKTALVIGGSSAAGAGVGALVGGKKGALIGGIAGGAAGSAYEIHKRHHKRYRRRV